MKAVRPGLRLISFCCALAALPASTDSFESSFRFALLKSFDDASGKILQLAEAIPESQYRWQPMVGVNTVRDVLVHVTEANLELGQMLGGIPPAGLDRRSVGTKMQTKEEVIAITRKAMDHVRGVLKTIPATELSNEIDFYGSRASKVHVTMVTTDHAHEHLGQLIAYARINHIAPPWSR